jgi:hypothetical protein
VVKGAAPWMHTSEPIVLVMPGLMTIVTEDGEDKEHEGRPRIYWLFLFIFDNKVSDQLSIIEGNDEGRML